MWATHHPWEVDRFLELTSPAFVQEACAENETLFGDHEVSDELAAEISTRLWIWLIPSRQEEMSMGPVHRGYVLQGVMGGQA